MYWSGAHSVSFLQSNWHFARLAGEAKKPCLHTRASTRPYGVQHTSARSRAPPWRAPRIVRAVCMAVPAQPLQLNVPRALRHQQLGRGRGKAFPTLRSLVLHAACNSDQSDQAAGQVVLSFVCVKSQHVPTRPRGRGRGACKFASESCEREGVARNTCPANRCYFDSCRSYLSFWIGLPCKKNLESNDRTEGIVASLCAGGSTWASHAQPSRTHAHTHTRAHTHMCTCAHRQTHRQRETEHHRSTPRHPGRRSRDSRDSLRVTSGRQPVTSGSAGTRHLATSDASAVVHSEVAKVCSLAAAAVETTAPAQPPPPRRLGRTRERLPRRRHRRHRRRRWRRWRVGMWRRVRSRRRWSTRRRRPAAWLPAVAPAVSLPRPSMAARPRHVRCPRRAPRPRAHCCGRICGRTRRVRSGATHGLRTRTEDGRLGGS